MADDNNEETKADQEARHQEACPYYKALLSIIAVTQEIGSCDDEALQACLQAEGIGEFYVYSQTLLDATEGESFDEEDEAGVDPANPEQENDEEASDEFEADTL